MFPSLVSISHRISGVINYLFFIFLCIRIFFVFLFGQHYNLFADFFNSIFGKFFVISIIWSFSFQILSEIRHLFWDLGYGFEIKTSNITGILDIIGSFALTITIYLFSRNLL